MKTYEEAFSELELLVKKLEDEQTTIDDAINYFKQAIELQKYCEKILIEAQDKVTKILDETGVEADFDVK